MHLHLCQLPHSCTSLHYRIMGKTRKNDVISTMQFASSRKQQLSLLLSKEKIQHKKSHKDNPYLIYSLVPFTHLYVSEFIFTGIHQQLTFHRIYNKRLKYAKGGSSIKHTHSNVNKTRFLLKTLLCMLLAFPDQFSLQFTPNFFSKCFAHIPFVSLLNNF